MLADACVFYPSHTQTLTHPAMVEIRAFRCQLKSTLSRLRQVFRKLIVSFCSGLAMGELLAPAGDGLEVLEVERFWEFRGPPTLAFGAPWRRS